MRGEGLVARKELKVVMRALGVEVRKESLARLQIGKTGPVEFEEFLIMMKAILNEKEVQEEMMKTFNLFDVDDTGRITFENLKAVAEQLNETISDGELAEMIREADINGDGGVSAVEFVRIMKRTDLWTNPSMV